MLRLLRGTWLWHGKAEGDYPPPALTPWHMMIATSIHFFLWALDRLYSAGFVLHRKLYRQSDIVNAQNLAVIGSFLSRIGSLSDVI